MRIVEYGTLPEILGHYPLLKQLYNDLTPENYADYSAGLLAMGYKQAAIYVNGACVAVTGFHVATHLSSGSYLYIDDLVVDSEHRNKDYARALLCWLEEKALILACNYIFLDAFVENSPAHRLYHSQNFSIAAFHFIKKL